MKIKKIKIQNDPIFGTAEFDFTDKITYIGEDAFSSSNLTNVYISRNIEQVVSQISTGACRRHNSFRKATSGRVSLDLTADIIL